MSFLKNLFGSKVECRDENDLFNMLSQRLQDKYTQKEAELKLRFEARKLEHMQHGAKDWKNFEHEYHQGMEERKVVLARLDAEIEAKTQLLAVDQEVLKEKQRTIDTLTDLLKTLAQSLPQREYVVESGSKKK